MTQNELMQLESIRHNQWLKWFDSTVGSQSIWLKEAFLLSRGTNVINGKPLIDLPRWLMQIGTATGLRNQAFEGSSPSWGTI